MTNSNFENGFYIARIDDKYYPYFWDGVHGQAKWGSWFATHCESGIKYVSASYKTYSGAYKAIMRKAHSKTSYKGIWNP